MLTLLAGRIPQSVQEHLAREPHARVLLASVAGGELTDWELCELNELLAEIVMRRARPKGDTHT